MKKKILVIDDEVNYGRMIKINLEQTGNFDVDAVSSATDGYQKIKESNYDLIFLDVLMPKVEGHVALGEIRKMCKTPVLIMSAYIPPQKLDAILKSGAQGCLEKPVPLDRLEKVIQDALANAK